MHSLPLAEKKNLFQSDKVALSSLVLTRVPIIYHETMFGCVLSL